MKRKTLAGFAVLLPLTIALCACGGSAPLELSANWYRFSDSPNNVAGKSERLEYEVTFDASDSNQILSYEKGSYVTTLEAEILPGSSELGYHLSAEFAITGKYSLGDESETFSDVVKSDVYFKILSSRLQPVKSEKYVKTTSPLTARPSSLENAFRVYEYTYTVVYDDPLDEAEITYSQTLPEEAKKEKTVSVGGSTFYDNEQLLFVLRGLSMDAAVSLETINPLDFSVTGVGMPEKPTLTPLTDIQFEMNGNTVAASESKPINAYLVSLSYNNSFPGQTQTLLYAANTRKEAGENLYRNVLLQMNVPILQGLGSFNYKLIGATFTE